MDKIRHGFKFQFSDPHLGGHPGVVVDERDDPCIKTSLGRVVDTVHVLSVCFVLLADSTAGNSQELNFTASQMLLHVLTINRKDFNN